MNVPHFQIQCLKERNAILRLFFQKSCKSEILFNNSGTHLEVLSGIKNTPPPFKELNAFNTRKMLKQERKHFFSKT